MDGSCSGGWESDDLATVDGPSSSGVEYSYIGFYVVILSGSYSVAETVSRYGAYHFGAGFLFATSCIPYVVLWLDTTGVADLQLPCCGTPQAGGKHCVHRAKLKCH
jgi:hypothetical protein